MSKILHDRCIPLVGVFCAYESQLYQWAGIDNISEWCIDPSDKEYIQKRVQGKTSLQRQEEWSLKIATEICDYDPGDNKFDYIRIQSITNIGLLGAELKLSSKVWGLGQDLLILLPPSPGGSINFSVKKSV